MISSTSTSVILGVKMKSSLEQQLKGKSVWAVIWDDAHGNGGDVSADDFHHAPWQYLTVGVLLQDDEVGVSLAQDLGEDGNYRGSAFIPAAMVVKKWRIKGVTPPKG